jgi:hypothetical protein
MMATDQFLEQLGYRESDNFLTKELLPGVIPFSHVFRRAIQNCGLIGVYTLHREWDAQDNTIVPIIYVCEAQTSDEADRIHRLIWNQNIVPFALVKTLSEIRVYSGFAYHRDADDQTVTEILKKTIAIHEISSQLVPSFHAHRIDDGTLWRREGQFVIPNARVDGKLLSNLDTLGKILHEQMGLSLRAAQALIGKYVYLRYLRDRQILSPEKLVEFEVLEEDVFSRNATLSGLKTLIRRVDNWLNGAIFDIPWQDAITDVHIREVAGAFFGDDPETGQLNLFEDYDFSYIPIETLSVVYEQFLHATGKAQKAGAYYTPIPLVNFVLDALEELKPLRSGMRLLDPACGSGAFLVQCYRRLIEKEVVNRQKLRPVELRELLQRHIFGIERDEAACQVAELSLVLTLLDYITPPDLTRTNFKLPILRGKNIFGGFDEDFFNTQSSFHQTAGNLPFDWVIGNPPWTEISTEHPLEEDKAALHWKNTYSQQYPTGGNQVAELFAWKATEHIDNTGVVGLLLPAMTLFKDESTLFRQRFFQMCKVESVVNFANMVEVLFAGRSRVPCAAFFYRVRTQAEYDVAANEKIITYAPFVLNQESNRPLHFNQKLETWSVVVNGSELREIPTIEAADGDALTWKLAMWGSYRDKRLLESVKNRFTTFEQLAARRHITALQGFELRDQTSIEEGNDDEIEEGNDDKIFVEELVDKYELRANNLRRFGRLFTFPPLALRKIARNRAYIRKRGGLKPLIICRPPHIIVSASRKYAVFSNEFIAVPPRQIGIAGPQKETQFLKLLSLYLSSDFTIYHQLLCAPRWGIHISDSNLSTLNVLPIPLEHLSKSEASDWLTLHAKLAAIPPLEKRNQPLELFEPYSHHSQFITLIRELNERVYELLNLDETERLLIEDFVHVKRHATQGKVTKQVAGTPTDEDLLQYGRVLAQELDSFFEDEPNYRHAIKIYRDGRTQSGIIEIRSQCNSANRIEPEVIAATGQLSTELSQVRSIVREQRAQWLYFDRNLRIFEGTRTFLLKPLQLMHWLRSQALLDADAMISDILIQEV